MKLRVWITPPVAPAVTAHVISWVFTLLFYQELRRADDLSNTTAIIVIVSPIALTGLVLMCALEKSGRQLVWGIAIGTSVLACLGIATIGLFLLPLVGLLFWTATTMPKD